VDPGQQVSQGRSTASRDVLLAAKDRRIQELEAANRRLEAEKRQLQERLKVALGKVYEQQ
jgi:FtsZ-binding cell division protein ZapB